MKSLSRVRLFEIPWTVAHQAPPSMEFCRREYWSGLPFLSRDLPNPGMEPRSPTWWADALPSEPPGNPPMQETQVQSLGQEDPWVEGMTTYSYLENSMDRGVWQATVHSSYSS